MYSCSCVPLFNHFSYSLSLLNEITNLFSLPLLSCILVANASLFCFHIYREENKMAIFVSIGGIPGQDVSSKSCEGI
jgi:hypothetical protein